MIYKKSAIILVIILALISCEKSNNKTELVKEDKFTLSLGNMENELDFFSREGIPFSLKSDISMSNGIFFISNGNGKKIMKFNSYGDLLQIISSDNQVELSNDLLKWEFNEPGSLSITDNYIYIEDTLKYDIALSDNYIDKSRDLTFDKSDKEKHILNEKVILMFDNTGKFVKQIKQEGNEGDPFPFINNIYNDSKNRLIIVTQTTYFWDIFRFNEDGSFLDKNTIDLTFLPQLENENNTITQLNNIIPDRNKDRLLVELTFYKKIFDEKTDAIISMENIKSRIYYYDLTEKNYISWMDVPVSKNDKDDIYKQYVLMDIAKGKYLYFISQGIDGTSQFLTITNENGYIIGEYDLNIDNSNIIYTSFYATNPDGILIALLCTEYAGGISLWRTDKILDEDLK